MRWEAVSIHPIQGLLSAFGAEGEAAAFAELAGDAVPEPFRGLLVHDGHMTVTAEAYHGGPVLLHVHDTRQTGDSYARKITLHTRPDGPAVLVGLMRIDLRCCPPAMRDEITAGRTPLGRVLVRHDVLRRIQPGPYYRVRVGRELLGIEVAAPDECYGRFATMQVNGQAAVELLEIVTRV